MKLQETIAARIRRRPAGRVIKCLPRERFFFFESLPLPVARRGGTSDSAGQLDGQQLRWNAGLAFEECGSRPTFDLRLVWLRHNAGSIC
jgi:hypothetical protein